jgi:hypothetical protein
MILDMKSGAKGYFAFSVLVSEVFVSGRYPLVKALKKRRLERIFEIFTPSILKSLAIRNLI